MILSYFFRMVYPNIFWLNLFSHFSGAKLIQAISGETSRSQFDTMDDSSLPADPDSRDVFSSLSADEYDIDTSDLLLVDVLANSSLSFQSFSFNFSFYGRVSPISFSL